MLTNIWQHPKSTLIGIAQAALSVLLNGRDGKTVTIAVINAILFALMKDPSAPTTK